MSRIGRRRMAVISGGACLMLAATDLLLGFASARADNAPGSGWLAYSFSATAPGTQLTEDRTSAAAHPEGEGEVPESLAQLASGPEGYALSSIAWPGPLAANAGSTAQLLNLGLPSSTTDTLNEPVRAEARTGSGSPTVTNDSYPGTQMKASAAPGDVEADATTAGTAGPAPRSGTGNTETASSVKLTGAASGEATASSVVQDVSLAGGVVTMGSVTSRAKAATDGVKATASGTTTVFDLRVGGQPAYLDQTGLHLGSNGPGEPVNVIASQLAQQALAGAGMRVAVSQPTEEPDGSRITYDAGNVVFYWAPPNSQGETFTATFGGASVSAGASPGLASGSTAAGGNEVAGSSSSPPPAGSAGRGPSRAVSSLAPAVASTGGVSAEPGAVPGVVKVAPASATGPLRLPNGLPPALWVLVLLGSGLIGWGMRRLPDRVLEAPATTCSLGGRT